MKQSIDTERSNSLFEKIILEELKKKKMVDKLGGRFDMYSCMRRDPNNDSVEPAEPDANSNQYSDKDRIKLKKEQFRNVLEQGD